MSVTNLCACMHIFLLIAYHLSNASYMPDHSITTPAFWSLSPGNSWGNRGLERLCDLFKVTQSQSGLISARHFSAQNLLYSIQLGKGGVLRKNIFQCAKAKITEFVLYLYYTQPQFPNKRMQVCLLSILLPPFRLHPGLHQFPESSFTPCSQSWAKQNPPCCLSWVPGRYSNQDLAPIFSHGFWAPEKWDFQSKPSFLFPPETQSFVTPLSMSFASWSKVWLGSLPGSPLCQSRSLSSRALRRWPQLHRRGTHRSPTKNILSLSQAQNLPRFGHTRALEGHSFSEEA